MSGFDLDAARAARIEASGAPFPFTFGGEDFTIPAPKEWPVGATSLMADARLAEAVALLLGEQVSRFNAHEPRLGDIEALFEAISAWQGATPGE